MSDEWTDHGEVDPTEGALPDTEGAWPGFQWMYKGFYPGDEPEPASPQTHPEPKMSWWERLMERFFDS